MLQRLKALLAALAVAATLSAAAAAAPDAPKQVIESYYAQLMNAMQNGARLGYKGRYELLKPWVEKTFNVALMAQTSVGSYWDSMTAAQRTALVDAFRNFTVANYAHNFPGYEGEKFVTSGIKETPRKDIIVYTAIVKSDGDKVPIDYLLRADGDSNYQVIERLSRRLDLPARHAALGIHLRHPRQGGRRPHLGDPQEDRRSRRLRRRAARSRTSS